MSKGVLVIFGQTSFSSGQTIKSYADRYNIPFININHPKHILDKENREQENNIKFKPVEQDNLKFDKKIHDDIKQIYQFFMHPDLVPLLISLTKYHRWKSVYYLYNNQEGNLIYYF